MTLLAKGREGVGQSPQTVDHPMAGNGTVLADAEGMPDGPGHAGIAQEQGELTISGHRPGGICRTRAYTRWQKPVFIGVPPSAAGRPGDTDRR